MVNKNNESKKREIVINKCHGGFSPSYKAIMLYAKLSGFKLYPWADDSIKRIYKTDNIDKLRKTGAEPCLHYARVPIKNEKAFMKRILNKKTKNEDKEKYDKISFNCRDISREDPILIKVIKKLKKEANSKYSDLRIVKIPASIDWTIEEYDGREWIAEKHRTWS